MSLNFDVKKVKDYEKVTTHPTDPNLWHPKTEAIVMYAMICGFRDITEKNHNDVFKRINRYEKVFGPALSKASEDGKGIERVFITEEDITKHIGLTTNVSKKTDTQFAKVLMRD